MALSFKGSSRAGVRGSFESMLEALESDAEPSPSKSFANLTIPLGSVSAPLGVDIDCGARGQWELRYEWIEEASASEVSLQRPTLPSASVEAVADELKLDGARSASDLRRLRREFMWRNHPDRRPEIPRDLANARVAVANMLIDRALSKAAVKSENRV